MRSREDVDDQEEEIDYGYGDIHVDSSAELSASNWVGDSSSSFGKSKSTHRQGNKQQTRRASGIMSSTTGRAVVNSIAAARKTSPIIYAHASAKGAYDSHNVCVSSSDNNTENNNNAENYSKHYDTDFLKICQLDKEREHLLNMVEEPNMFKLLNHWKGTIFDEIVYDVVFWLTLILYIILRLWERLSAKYLLDQEVDDVRAKEASDVLDSLPIVGGFLTLFLVFFVNQNHARYFSLHEDTMYIMGRICDLSALLVSSSLPIARARRINRYCNAAQVVMYAGLSEHLQEGKLIHTLCRDYALLTEVELSRMIEVGIYQGKIGCSFELLTWALLDVNRAVQLQLLDLHQASEMRQQIVQFRSTIAKIFVTTLCPIPFFYVHFLALLTAIYLPLFALMVSFKTSSGSVPPEEEEGGGEEQHYQIIIPWYAELVGVSLVLLQSFLVIGLRMLGQQLGNPYGEDFIDLQITSYITMTLSTSNRILESIEINNNNDNNDNDNIRSNDIDPSVELDLKMRMISLGDAYGIKQQQQQQQQQQQENQEQQQQQQQQLQNENSDSNGIGEMSDNNNNNNTSNSSRSANKIQELNELYSF